MVPGSLLAGTGGAVGLVHGARSVVVLGEHVARDGSPTILQRCTLPPTGAGVADRTITDLAVIDVLPPGAGPGGGGGLLLRELAPGVSVERVRAATGAALAVADDLVEVTSG